MSRLHACSHLKSFSVVPMSSQLPVAYLVVCSTLSIASVMSVAITGTVICYGRSSTSVTVVCFGRYSVALTSIDLCWGRTQDSVRHVFVQRYNLLSLFYLISYSHLDSALSIACCHPFRWSKFRYFPVCALEPHLVHTGLIFDPGNVRVATSRSTWT